MEAVRKLAYFACLAAVLGSFALGLGLALPWPWELAVLVCAAAWLLDRGDCPSLALAVSILVAATGILLKAPAWPMILGTAASLALWDFARAEIPDDEAGDEAREALANYRRARAPYLLAALGIGTAAAIIGSGRSVGMPFFAMTLCVLACAFGLDRLVARLRDNGQRRR
jgi:hypothetical protein